MFQPKAVSETEEQDLAQLMAKAGQENAEVSGDEDDEEGIWFADSNLLCSSELETRHVW